MFTLKARTTNVRPSKTEVAEVSTTPTHGNFKINAPASLVLGVKTGDYLDVVIGNDDALYVAKGVAPVKDEAGKTIEAAIGAKLASTNGKMSGTLGASSANTYESLKGSKEANMIYTMDVENPKEFEGTLYYRLEFSREEAKQLKVRKAVEA